jgi:hypothetical protein
MTLSIAYRAIDSLPSDVLVTLTDRDGDSASLPYEFAYFLTVSQRGDVAYVNNLYVTRMHAGCELRHTNIPNPSVCVLLWESQQAFLHELDRAMCVALLSK